MAYSKALLPLVAVLLVVLPMVAMADLDSNHTASFYEKLPQNDDDDDDDEHEFLPCVFPNCTLNYGTGQPAPPPVPQKEVPRNISAFDPCYWMYCGEGQCTKNGTYRHTCTCNPGFSNLLNISYYPCYGPATLGSDCNDIIKVANSTSSGNGTTTGSNPASTILPAKLQWMVILLISMLMALK
ncbi:NEUROGENIC LOCUS NOTCH-LIKE PROTEIN [Salix purpurea]|uniref:NEUROGENIC LOCUS NOTCH-LIKE PROTEIN n=1 Tax=Salix purpurea TaxID=77065 RepID=A0A9Q0W913_SALPP|nr:NEUROGENIC LOCUS NOTCH-LIKE PROTEIN [Salix purpurea]